VEEKEKIYKKKQRKELRERMGDYRIGRLNDKLGQECDMQGENREDGGERYYKGKRKGGVSAYRAGKQRKARLVRGSV